MSRIVQPGATGPFGLTANGLFQQQAQSINLYGSTGTDSSITTLLGSRWSLEDGREIVLILAGAANLAVGKLMQDAALIANHSDLTVTAFTAYTTNGNQPATVTVTLGGTAVTANEYQLGYAAVVDGTGAGQTLQIASHPAQATTTGNVTLTLADAPNTALDTTSKISLVFQPGNGVVVHPASASTNSVRGITFYPVTAANYAYLISKGTQTCLADSSAPAAGLAISASTGTAGAIAAFSTDTEVIGRTIYATVSAKYYPVNIDV
jgi:hypothetical protein